MYGTQTVIFGYDEIQKFENDVEMYGTQTSIKSSICGFLFENDVEMYGTQTSTKHFSIASGPMSRFSTS